MKNKIKKKFSGWNHYTITGINIINEILNKIKNKYKVKLRLLIITKATRNVLQ